MKTLGQDWITEKHVDFEYKKYVLLAYLQEVNRHFEETKLYPCLAELVGHYRNLLTLKENKDLLYSHFPENLQALDLESLKMIFKKISLEDAVMKEVEEIIDFSLPQMEKYLAEGKKIYDFIEEHLTIMPVGVIPLYPMEGYFFLKSGKNKETKVYEYQITIFERPDEKFRGIHSHFITAYKRSFSNTYEDIKLDLIRSNKKLPNPATYAIETEMELPLEETFLPIAKRVLVKYIN